MSSIEETGFPLGFEVSPAEQRPVMLDNQPGRDVITVEARMLQGHQREAVVKEGENGSSWRLTCDEGKHQIGGTDLAPFPLGHFNAALHSDLIGRMIVLARTRAIELTNLQIDLQNHYWMTGSFFRGTGVGFADPASINIEVASEASAQVIKRLVDDAIKASPAMAAMRLPLENTFALYANGRRLPVAELPASQADDAADPYRTYSQPPAPLREWVDNHTIIRKTGQTNDGSITPAETSTKTRIVRNIFGNSTLVDPLGIIETDTVLGLPGMSHFAIRSDERIDGHTAPCGLSFQASGIAFCFMTQLARYIEHMKFAIEGIRVVQYCPYALIDDGAGLSGISEPVDTHLFLNGRAEDTEFGKLMHVAARTCYLHATLAAALEPNVSIKLNGNSV